MSKLHNQKEYDDNRHKRKHDEEHHKKEHNDNGPRRKYNKNYHPENEFLNSFKTFIEEINNYIPLKNNIEEDKPDLSKDDDLGNKIEEENQDLSKDDDLGNKIEEENQDLFKNDDLGDKEYSSFQYVYNEDFIEENHNTIAKEEFSKEAYKDQEDDLKIENCKTTVISETLTVCENIPHTSEVNVGTVTVKIPVVLTESTITITIESTLKLEDVVLQIKQIRKNVYLNQCKLIPNSENGQPNTGVLFIDGFIRKNIEYITKGHIEKEVSCEKVKQVIVKVPFKCATRVSFNTYPKFKQNMYQDEVEILQTNRVYDSCGVDITGVNIREQNFKMIEFFNEKVFCELISAEILESDILENPINKELKTSLEKGFHHITEKVVLFLTVELLQNQHVEISKGVISNNKISKE